MLFTESSALWYVNPLCYLQRVLLCGTLVPNVTYREACMWYVNRQCYLQRVLLCGMLITYGIIVSSACGMLIPYAI